MSVFVGTGVCLWKNVQDRLWIVVMEPPVFSAGLVPGLSDYCWPLDTVHCQHCSSVHFTLMYVCRKWDVIIIGNKAPGLMSTRLQWVSFTSPSVCPSFWADFATVFFWQEHTQKRCNQPTNYPYNQRTNTLWARKACHFTILSRYLFHMKVVMKTSTVCCSEHFVKVCALFTLISQYLRANQWFHSHIVQFPRERHPINKQTKNNFNLVPVNTCSISFACCTRTTWVANVMPGSMPYLWSLDLHN